MFSKVLKNGKYPVLKKYYSYVIQCKFFHSINNCFDWLPIPSGYWFIERMYTRFCAPQAIPCFDESSHSFLDPTDIELKFPKEFPNSVDFNNKSCQQLFRKEFFLTIKTFISAVFSLADSTYIVPHFVVTANSNVAKCKMSFGQLGQLKYNFICQIISFKGFHQLLNSVLITHLVVIMSA